MKLLIHIIILQCSACIYQDSVQGSPSKSPSSKPIVTIKLYNAPADLFMSSENIQAFKSCVVEVYPQVESEDDISILSVEEAEGGHTYVEITTSVYFETTIEQEVMVSECIYVPSVGSSDAQAYSAQDDDNSLGMTLFITTGVLSCCLCLVLILVLYLICKTSQAPIVISPVEEDLKDFMVQKGPEVAMANVGENNQYQRQVEGRESDDEEVIHDDSIMLDPIHDYDDDEDIDELYYAQRRLTEGSTDRPSSNIPRKRGYTVTLSRPIRHIRKTGMASTGTFTDFWKSTTKSAHYSDFAPSTPPRRRIRHKRSVQRSISALDPRDLSLSQRSVRSQSVRKLSPRRKISASAIPALQSSQRKPSFLQKKFAETSLQQGESASSLEDLPPPPAPPRPKRRHRSLIYPKREPGSKPKRSPSLPGALQGIVEVHEMPMLLEDSEEVGGGEVTFE